MAKRFRSSFTIDGQEYERTSMKSQEEADRKAAEYKKAIENGDVGISKKMKVATFAVMWLETYKKQKLTAGSYANDERYVNNVVIPKIGNLRLINVTDMHLQSILNARAKDGYSYSDVKKLRDIFKAIFRKALENKLILYSPAVALEMPRCPKGKRRSLTVFEREHFLKVAENHYAGLMFLIMLFCGLRPGEVMALMWKDIDFDSHMINIVAAIENGTNTIKGPKTEAGVRSIPIPDVYYYKLLESRPESYSPFSPVFTQETTGNRHTEYSFRSSWKSLKNAMDYSMGAKREKAKAKDGKLRYMKVNSVIAPDLIPYYLRHTYCTDLQQKGISLKMASYLMGHTDIAVTANIYTHVTAESLQDVARLIGVETVHSTVREAKTG